MAAPQPRTRAKKRLTREDWITAARKSLVDRGIDEVKIDRLARSMRVSRGSFYWHFKRRDDLLDALLSDWEARNDFEITQVRDRWARNTPDITAVVAIWLGEDSNTISFDLAIRSWGRRSREVAASVKRVDKAWIALLQENFARDCASADEALVRARVTYFHQIGYWALDFDEARDERLRLVPIYYRVLTGHDAPAEIGELVKQQAPAATKPPRHDR
jgi:AcrR family transcriptional regulator